MTGELRCEIFRGEADGTKISARPLVAVIFGACMQR